MRDVVRKTIWKRGEWALIYSQECAHYDCGCFFTAPVIEIRNDECYVTSIHTRVLLGRNRSLTECVSLGINRVLEWEAKERHAKLEAEIASEEASALAEIANDIAPTFAENA
jgi:hypothetical protein